MRTFAQSAASVHSTSSGCSVQDRKVWRQGCKDSLVHWPLLPSRLSAHIALLGCSTLDVRGNFDTRSIIAKTQLTIQQQYGGTHVSCTLSVLDTKRNSDTWN